MATNKRQPSKKSQEILYRYTFEFQKIKFIPNQKLKAQQLNNLLNEMVSVDTTKITKTIEEKLQQLAYEIEDELIATQNKIKSSFKPLIISLVVLFLFVAATIGGYFGYQHWKNGSDPFSTADDDETDVVHDESPTPQQDSPTPNTNKHLTHTPTHGTQPNNKEDEKTKGKTHQPEQPNATQAGINLVNSYKQELDIIKEFPDNQNKLDKLDDLSKTISDLIKDPELQNIKSLLSNLHDLIKITRESTLKTIETQKTITTKKEEVKQIDTQISEKEERIARLRRVYKKEKYSVAQLIEAGATIQDMKVIGYTEDELIASNKFTNEEIADDKGKRFLTLSYDEKKAKIKNIEKKITDLRTKKVNLVNEIMKLDITNELDQQLKNDLKKNNILFQNTMDSIFSSLNAFSTSEANILKIQAQSLENSQNEFAKLQEQHATRLNNLVSINNMLSDFQFTLQGIKIVVERAEQDTTQNIWSDALNIILGNLSPIESQRQAIQSRESAVENFKFNIPVEHYEKIGSIVDSITERAYVGVNHKRRLKLNLNVKTVVNAMSTINNLIATNKAEIEELREKIIIEHKAKQKEIDEYYAKCQTLVEEKTKITNNPKYLIFKEQMADITKAKIEFKTFIDEKVKSLIDVVGRNTKEIEVNSKLDHIRQKQQELLKYCKAIKSPIASRLQEVINENKEQTEILDRVKQRLS